MTTAESVPPPRTRHPQALIEVGDRRAEVDFLLAPLITAIWEHGLSTDYSCQQQGWAPTYANPDDIWSYMIFSEIDDLRTFLDLFAHSPLSSRRFSQSPSREQREHHQRVWWRNYLKVEPPSFGARELPPDHPEVLADRVHFRAMLVFPADDIEAMTSILR